MFPLNTGSLPSGGQPTTSAANQQTVGLLGNQPTAPMAAMGVVDGSTLNSTAPSSSTTNPNVANMVKALKGGAQ